MDPLSYRIGIYCVLKEYTKFSYVKKKKIQTPRFEIKYDPKALRSLVPQTKELHTVHAVSIQS